MPAVSLASAAIVSVSKTMVNFLYGRAGYGVVIDHMTSPSLVMTPHCRRAPRGACVGFHTHLRGSPLCAVHDPSAYKSDTR
jgi:hypothetical protein